MPVSSHVVLPPPRSDQPRADGQAEGHQGRAAEVVAAPSPLPGRTDRQRLGDDTGEVEDHVDPLAGDLRQALTRLQGTLTEAESTLKNASQQIRGDTELAYQVMGTLAELETAARSLRVFLDMVERNPEVLLRGKREQ